MSEIRTLIEQLNNLKLVQKNSDWSDDIPSEIYETTFENKCKDITDNLQVKKHRWYETSISVIELDGYLIGIRSISEMFSEGQEYEDCYHILKFYLMKEITIKSYEITN